jgi:hypothetical protein
MSTSYLERVPTELLLRICSYLRTDDLRALALTSRRCNPAAVALLFRCITVNAFQLDGEAQGYKRILQRNTCSGGVRHLNVVQEGEPPAFADLDEDDYWTPLQALIRDLSSLSDLSWRCSSRVPEGLLQTLQHHVPSCGLHVREFRLAVPSLPNIRAEHLPLATSPNLRSIWFKYDDYQSNGEEDYTLEAVARITGRLAPNLSHVRAFRAPAGSSPELLRAWETPRRPFQWFVPGHAKAAGALKQLEVGGSQSTSAEDLEIWTECTDFKLLQTLKLETLIEPSALAYLASCRFQALKSLSLSLREQDETSPDVIDELFGRLPPLSSLMLKGELYRATLGDILVLHGATLRTLSLLPAGTSRTRLVLDAKDLTAIASRCPSLEHFELALARSKGDASEVEAYKALGSFPRLQTIKMFLDASNCEVLREPDDLGDSGTDDSTDYDTPNDPSFDDFDQQFFNGPFGTWLKPRNGHIRDAFINSAVDRALALSIFQTISAARPPGSLVLEELELLPTGGGNFGTPSSLSTITNVVRHVGRCWHLERNVRDDRRDEIVIEPLEDARGMHSDKGGDLGWDVMPIFRRIWPGAHGGDSDWRDDWRSWPLTTSNPR